MSKNVKTTCVPRQSALKKKFDAARKEARAQKQADVDRGQTTVTQVKIHRRCIVKNKKIEIRKRSVGTKTGKDSS